MFQRKVLDFLGNSVFCHFRLPDGADNAVAVAGGDHVYGNSTCKNQPFFDGLVAVAVADHKIIFCNTGLHDGPVGAGRAHNNGVGLVKRVEQAFHSYVAGKVPQRNFSLSPNAPS